MLLECSGFSCLETLNSSRYTKRRRAGEVKERSVTLLCPFLERKKKRRAIKEKLTQKRLKSE